MTAAKNRAATILIVDDDTSVIEILHDVLGQQYDVLFATSGLRALELVRAAAPDLILLDVMMPGMDGYEVCAHLKAAPATAQIPVMFITGVGDIAAETRGLEAGAVDYITKPVNPPAVRIRIRNQIELRRARQALELLADTDGLTLLANRRRFDHVFDAEFRRMPRSNAPLSLILLDVDCFKAYNDGFGHVAGDECLRRVAAVIQGSVHRGSDLPARYGGEEFAVLLPETHHKGALMIAEALRRGVADLRIPHPASPVAEHVTVSVGVVTAARGAFTQWTDIVAFADAQLYAAKRAGRDRVIAASRDEPGIVPRLAHA